MPSAMSADAIRILGARQHNLKNLDLEIPRNRLVVITGVSGSGKSSLAFDTLYAEGQRRYVESLSAYARQFLGQLEKPDVDFIHGLSPAIAIEQRAPAPNPRSTVATTTEIYDYLRILYSAVGQPHDPDTGTPLVRHTLADMVRDILALPERTRLLLLAPVRPQESESFPEFARRLQQQGFVRLRADGVVLELDRADLPATAEVTELVVDRLVLREDIRSRLADSLETALRWSGDRVLVLSQGPEAGPDAPWETRVFVTSFTNPETGFRLRELTPKHFSFNSHLGACPECHGLGSRLVPDAARFVPDPERSLRQGGVKTWWPETNRRQGLLQRAVLGLARAYGADPDAPIRTLPAEFKRALLKGSGDRPVPADWNAPGPGKPFEGLEVQALRLHEESASEVTKRRVRRFLALKPCRACGGRRLRPEILAVTLPHPDGPASIQDFCALTVERARTWLPQVPLSETQTLVVRDVVREIVSRLAFLEEVGLGYLTLDRESATLSGGESQRIRLATQLGSSLSGVLYVLDEPSIGLHQADNERLLRTLFRLRDAGNTLVVVEHDEETIRAADHLVDIGPGAGALGGRLLAQGTPDEVARHPDSVTGPYLAGHKRITPPGTRMPVPPRRSSPGGALDSGWLVVEGASEHNLQDIDAAFPAGCLTCVTGPSGSGKSTLVDTILRRVLSRHFFGGQELPGTHRAVTGLEAFDKAVVVDQSPIGRGPRSNPATYTGVFGPIRDLFSELPLSRQRGYDPGRFSFNVPGGGRCEACKGDGSLRIDMHFLTDVWVTCETCGGRRYNEETLQVTYRGKHIADVLDLSLDEARVFFQNQPAIHPKLRAACDVGLGYLRLGQPANTLSGGEAQRVKLAAELGRKATGNTLYLFDEPTTGLHFEDIQVLLGVLFQLRDAGNTLIVVEHNLDVIRCADWILDLGPGGGRHGGRLVAAGTPEDLAAHPESLTGRFLRGRLP
jgi:excinuclease ABC subunit A